jgi:hypothetical protein
LEEEFFGCYNKRMDCQIILTVLQPVLLVAAGVLGALTVYLLTRAGNTPSFEQGSSEALVAIDMALRLQLGEWWPVTMAIVIVLLLALVFFAAAPVLATKASAAAQDWRSQIPLYFLLYAVVVLVTANALVIYLDDAEDAMSSAYVQLLSQNVISPDKATRHRHFLLAVGGLVALGAVAAVFCWWYQIHGKSFSWESVI